MGLIIALGLLVLGVTVLVLQVKGSVEEVTRSHRLRNGKIVALAATAGGLVVLPFFVGDDDDVNRVRDLREALGTRSAQVQPLGSDPWKDSDLARASAEQEAEADALQRNLEADGFQVIRSDSLDLRTLEPNPRGFFLPSDQLKALEEESNPRGFFLPSDQLSESPDEDSADDADVNWPPWSPEHAKRSRPAKKGLASLGQ